MRLRQLRGLPVIDPTAARKIGTVVDYQVDPATSRLAALDVAGMNDSRGERVPAQRIRRVGGSAVILTAQGGSLPSTAPDVNERWLDTSTLVGLEVMGDDGDRIGHLVDALFDQDELNIQTYLLNASLFERLLGRRARIEPGKVHACSRELMMVTTGRVKEVEETATQTMPSLEVPMTPKEADRLPVPTYEPIENGQPVGARRR